MGCRFPLAEFYVALRSIHQWSVESIGRWRFSRIQGRCARAVGEFCNDQDLD